MSIRQFATIALAAAFAGCAAPTNPGVESLEPSVYGAWNTNDDECLDQNEFSANWEDQFVAWDEDDNSFIENDEWAGEIAGEEDDEFGAFGEWDANADDQLSDTEFATGSFGVFDADDNDCIAQNEWSAGIDLFN